MPHFLYTQVLEGTLTYFEYSRQKHANVIQDLTEFREWNQREEVTFMLLKRMVDNLDRLRECIFR